LEEGPEEDPSILLSGVAEFGTAPHRVLAVRVNATNLRVDFLAGVDADIYADHELEVMLDELRFFGSIDRSVVVRLESGDYVIWMVPSQNGRSG
ncbi:MAG: hypothetical protein M3Y41_15960, partial [Pseudomonadota bacterium]|nr:hypothetical protein [Pseudomonadota bacterium]